MAKISWCAGAISLLLLTGCTVDWQNRHAAQEVAQLSAAPGSVYLGWRVFQDKCAACHGAAATGTANAPDLLPRVRAMGERQFVSLVLQRYDLNQPATQVRSGTAAGEAQVEVVMQRKDAPLSMPAWQSEPRVNAHILDLHAYLSARAQGRQGTERPTP
ncbi:MAG: c-type cytochrome [Hylemonella sp.]